VTGVMVAPSEPRSGEPWNHASIGVGGLVRVAPKLQTVKGRREQRVRRRHRVWRFSGLKRERPCASHRYVQMGCDVDCARPHEHREACPDCRLDPGRPAMCGRFPQSTKDGVQVRTMRDEDGSREAFYGGLQTCGSIWCCPVCSANIRHSRAQQIESIVTEHLARGGGVEFATLTLRHQWGDALDVLMDAVAQGWSRVYKGSAYRARKDRLGIIGAPIRALEVTVGPNGWHPHLHVLVFTDAPWTDDERDDFSSALFSSWQTAVVAMGASAPSEDHGVLVKPVREAFSQEMGRYLAKLQDEGGHERSVALEIARGDLKVGRSGPGRIATNLVPFELLDLMEGPSHELAVRLWREYEQATFRRNAITGITPHLRRLGLLAADEEDPTDEELSEPELDETVLELVVPTSTWALVTRMHADGDLLLAVERGGAVAGRELLRQLQSVTFDRAGPALREAWPVGL
jgi:hypothetical protein